MFLLPYLIKDNHSCKPGYKWFLDHYPSGEESSVIFGYLMDEGYLSWAAWFAGHLQSQAPELREDVLSVWREKVREQMKKGSTYQQSVQFLMRSDPIKEEAMQDFKL